jgi:hypothetical protein
MRRQNTRRVSLLFDGHLASRKYTPSKGYGASEPTAQRAPDYPSSPTSRRGGGFGRSVVYVVLVIIALAAYRQFHDPDQMRRKQLRVFGRE